MSSSEEDENLKNFAAAVDGSLFNDNFYKPDHEKKETQEVVKVEAQKSQRYLDLEDEIEKSEIKISESMKTFMFKRMSALIEKDVEYVNVKGVENEDESVDCVRLLRGCTEFLQKDPAEEILNTIKVPIKRRKIRDDNEVEVKLSKKLELAATDINKIQRETESWEEKKNLKKIFNYKKIGQQNYLQEEPNEFTKARKKNNWNESKIQKTKFHGKSLNKI